MKWEYKVTNIPLACVMFEHLSILGNQGWELMMRTEEQLIFKKPEVKTIKENLARLASKKLSIEMHMADFVKLPDVPIRLSTVLTRIMRAHKGEFTLDQFIREYPKKRLVLVKGCAKVTADEIGEMFTEVFGVSINN